VPRCSGCPCSARPGAVVIGQANARMPTAGLSQQRCAGRGAPCPTAAAAPRSWCAAAASPPPPFPDSPPPASTSGPQSASHTPAVCPARRHGAAVTRSAPQQAGYVAHAAGGLDYIITKRHHSMHARSTGPPRHTFCRCLKRAAARLRAQAPASAWYTKKQPPLNPDTCATRSAATTRLFCSRTDCFSVEPLVRSERPDEPAVAPLRAPRPPPLLACCSCGSAAAAAAALRVATAPRLPAAFRSEYPGPGTAAGPDAGRSSGAAPPPTSGSRYGCCLPRAGCAGTHQPAASIVQAVGAKRGRWGRRARGDAHQVLKQPVHRVERLLHIHHQTVVVTVRRDHDPVLRSSREAITRVPCTRGAQTACVGGVGAQIGPRNG